MKFNSQLAESTCLGNHRKSTRLAAVSVMIFAVLMMANFKALLSCLSFANMIAVMESSARMPPMYLIHAPYPS